MGNKNLNKCKWVFYTVFLNVPYTDEEWGRTNTARSLFLGKVRLRNPVLKTRPSWSFKYGPTCYSHEEARSVCEKALKVNKAQTAKYTVYSNHNREEEWILDKNGTWKQTFGKAE